jgi:hypothetical protein
VERRSPSRIYCYFLHDRSCRSDNKMSIRKSSLQLEKMGGSTESRAAKREYGIHVLDSRLWLEKWMDVNDRESIESFFNLFGWNINQKFEKRVVLSGFWITNLFLNQWFIFQITKFRLNQQLNMWIKMTQQPKNLFNNPSKILGKHVTVIARSIPPSRWRQKMASCETRVAHGQH